MRWARLLWLLPLFAGTLALLLSGSYGLTLFVVLPVLVGAIGAAITDADESTRAAAHGAYAVGISLCGFLAIGAEGLICTVMAAPLAMPLGWIGGALWHATKRRHAKQGTAMLLLLPMASLGWDFTATPEIYEVHSSIEIAATPQQVWQHVVTFADLPEPTEWYFRTGIAYPLRARIEGTGPGAVRYCEFSTGPFVEPIEVWDEPRLLQFRVTKIPHRWISRLLAMLLLSAASDVHSICVPRTLTVETVVQAERARARGGGRTSRLQSLTLVHS